MPTTPRIASLFTGTGALDLAVQRVFGGTTVWHSQYEPPDKNGREDPHQYAAQILAHRFPGVPNLGDITKVDWQQVLDEHGPVDILTGGFPCQDVSSAGKQAGLVEGTRSGLWLQMAHAIAVLRPRLVVIENVEGLLSTKAASDVEPCAHCVGDPDREPPLRALGAVLGDLASLGFDAEWARVAASEVGAPHPRKRVFVLAWPADAAGPGLEGAGEGRFARRGQVAADSADVGHERRRGARDGGPGLADGDQVAADADGRGREGHQERDLGPVEGQPEHQRGLDTVRPGVRREALANTECLGREGQRGDAGPHSERQAAASLGRRSAGAGEAPADAASIGHGNAGSPGLGGVQATAVAGGPAAASDPDGFGQREAVLELRAGQSDVDWGDYEAAVRQWERVLGRPVPWPTDLRGRLSPVFTEWMMGLPDGWVTAVPGVTRSAMLRALGNGVVTMQAEAALRLLLARVSSSAAAA